VTSSAGFARMRIAATLLAAFLLRPDVALAQKWKDIGRTPAGNMVSVDPRSVKRTGSLVAANVRVVFTPPVAIAQGTMKSSRTVATFDCAKRSLAVKENTYYADERGAKRLSRTINKLPGYGPALGGSPVAMALDYLCKK
jgi:hypothetical protein